jgi:predicted Zn-dependent peptidase
LLACAWPGLVCARLDLAAATVEQLDNGLTLIVLEEGAFPVVSVQMLYRTGAKHEALGATGLAHFLEHMAFRSSENFPDTGLVSEIYGAGGEWHGYTWLDQTTYFATAPKSGLDLLLRIEADRMTRLLIPKEDVEAEIGAVLAEMHGYENDPGTVLQDNVLYVSFLAHPYRNNTIGWESDIAAIRHEEVLAFYRDHYQPGNAVLAVVGDVRAVEVRERVQQLFGGMEGRAPTPNPRTVEPLQQGERRVRLEGAVERKHFKIAWRAPSVHSPDFPAFLVLQELLAGGSGVSFLQNDWGTPARPGSPLGRVTDDLRTWYPPSEQDYVFIVSGTLPGDGDEAALEAAVQDAIHEFGSRLTAPDPAMEQSLESARKAVVRELLFDVQTTEDAAHQLSFFGGMDALVVLTGLPRAVENVRAADLRRALQAFLRANGRTIGWYVPESVPAAPRGAIVAPQDDLPAAVATAEAAVPSYRPASRSTVGPKPVRSVRSLQNGTPLILQTSPLSPTVLVKAVVTGAIAPEGVAARPNEPVHGVTSLDRLALPEEVGAAVAVLRGALERQSQPWQQPAVADRDPEGRLQAHFRDLLALAGGEPAGSGRPLLFVVSGDFDPERVQAMLEKEFGPTAPGPVPVPQPLNPTTRLEVESVLASPVAQERLGYVVRAPGPADAAAWWMTLYVLTHGYEGRLGKEAISRRGLVYYIDSEYRTNGRDGWITLDIGVDPAKLPQMRNLLRAELERLQREPPSPAEIDEARSHLLGRFVSAAQGNGEIADRLAREWLWFGQPLDYETLEAALADVTREDIHALLPAFVSGTIVSVRGTRH